MATQNPTSPGNPFAEAEVVKTPEADKVITVKVVKPVTLDGDKYQVGMTVKISEKQWRALSRHFEWIDGPKRHDPKNDAYINKAQAALDVFAPLEPDKLSDIIATAVQAALKAAPKAATCLALLLALFFTVVPQPAQAAPPSTFGYLSLPPMLALLPTNGLEWTGASVGVASGGTQTWTALTNANGVPTNIIAFNKYDEAVFVLTGGNQTGTSGFTNTFNFWQGDGTLTNWDTNHIILSLALYCPSGGSNGVLVTNVSRNLLGSSGYLVPGTIVCTAGGLASTNLSLRVQVKPIRSGN